MTEIVSRFVLDASMSSSPFSCAQIVVVQARKQLHATIPTYLDSRQFRDERGIFSDLDAQSGAKISDRKMTR